MALLADLQALLRNNPPAGIPFWPGAAVTGPFGLRRTRKELDSKASPAHLATDRARDGGDLQMSFDGGIHWRLVGGVAGSVLSENPDGVQMEIQIFHTEADTHVQEITEQLHKGDPLPVRASNLGFSIRVGGGTGIHTHMVLMFPYDRELHAWLRAGTKPIITRGAIDHDYVIEHCRRYRLNAATMTDKLCVQIDDWDLQEMTDRYAIRGGVPGYRLPQWGRGATIHVDSQWLLEI